MLFLNPFRDLKSGSSRRAIQESQRRQPAPCRLAVEALDDRIVPASLSVGDAVVFESFNGSYAEVVVTLSEPSNKRVTVNYNTANGTALDGFDYVGTSGTLTFARGETTKTIRVPVIADGVVDPDETFFVELSSVRYASIADSQGVVAIVDDGVTNYEDYTAYVDWNSLDAYGNPPLPDAQVP